MRLVGSGYVRTLCVHQRSLCCQCHWRLPPNREALSPSLLHCLVQAYSVDKKCADHGILHSSGLCSDLCFAQASRGVGTAQYCLRGL